jgi:hypothetical protein
MNIKNAEIETLIQQNQLSMGQRDLELETHRAEIAYLKSELSLVDRATYQVKQDLQESLERKHNQSLMNQRMQL